MQDRVVTMQQRRRVPEVFGDGTSMEPLAGMRLPDITLQELDDLLSEYEATRWLSWYGVGLASADRLPVVVRIPAGPLGSLKCDPPKGNGRRPQKKMCLANMK